MADELQLSLHSDTSAPCLKRRITELNSISVPKDDYISNLQPTLTLSSSEEHFTNSSVTLETDPNGIQEVQILQEQSPKKAKCSPCNSQERQENSSEIEGFDEILGGKCESLELSSESEENKEDFEDFLQKLVKNNSEDLSGIALTCSLKIERNEAIDEYPELSSEIEDLNFHPENSGGKQLNLGSSIEIVEFESDNKKENFEGFLQKRVKSDDKDLNGGDLTCSLKIEVIDGTAVVDVSEIVGKKNKRRGRKGKSNSIGNASNGHGRKLNSVGIASNSHGRKFKSIGIASNGHETKLNSTGIASNGPGEKLKSIGIASNGPGEKLKSIGIASNGSGRKLNSIGIASNGHGRKLTSIGIASNGHESKLGSIGIASNGHESKLNSIGFASNGHESKVNSICIASNGHESKLNSLVIASNGHGRKLKSIGNASNGDESKLNSIGIASNGRGRKLKSIVNASNGRGRKLNSIGVAVSALNGHGRRFVYSRKEMKVLRFLNVKGQRKFWQKIYNGFAENVKREYYELGNFKHHTHGGSTSDHNQAGKKRDYNGQGILGMDAARGRWNCPDISVC